tara:strand:+ start:2598 stop:3134 length:537 start_codon:yes stop_codon:yes gene_type:complete
MKFNKLDSFYITIDIDKKHKQPLLDLIDKMPGSFMHGISKSDWEIDKNHDREYLKYFKSIVSPHLDGLVDRLHFKKWTVDNAWFQQYEKNNGHDWHNHAYSNFSGVYYVELPDDDLATEYYDSKNNRIFERLNISEGQLLIIPSYILHRSPKNNSDSRKTIIAFNINFEEVKLKYAAV